MKLTGRKRALILAVSGAALLALVSFYVPLPRTRFDPKPVISLRLEDRNGVLLREVLSDEGGQCRWVGLSEISPALIKVTIASEDRSFPVHSGVNPFSIVRAIFQNLKSARVVSGASTITQQVVRNVYHFNRDLPSKLLETWLAVRLEHTLSKPEILAQYLNRISYGNQARGIEAASRLYFDKPASDLSLAEAAFLAALPRSPSGLNPYRNFSALKKRQEQLLKEMNRLKLVGREETVRALAEHLGVQSEKEKFRAPHFCDFVLEGLSPAERQSLAVVRTTLDQTLQEKVEILIQSHLGSLERKGVTNGAVVVLDNATGEILSMAGSRDFFDAGHDGQVNGALALRQPGSTMKALTYALALEKGLTAATILEDIPTLFPTYEGAFTPENYDQKYHGPIRLRSALASSYNVAAVSVLQALGPDLLFRRLKEMEFASLAKPPAYYGVGLTLGNGEVSLLELCRAYASLARGGVFLKGRAVREYRLKGDPAQHRPQASEPRRIFSAEASYIITDILSDRDARIPTFGYRSPLNFPFPCAVKTGTSKDFRDNWAVGYTPRTTVGVWVGNFDGRPMADVSGVTGAGPIFRDIMLCLEGGSKVDFERPADVVRIAICPLSGDLPSSSCPSTIEEIFVAGTEPREACRLSHKRGGAKVTASAGNSSAAKEDFWISGPRDGDVFKIDPVLRPDYQTLELQASFSERLNVRSVEWSVNGRLIGAAGPPFTRRWNLVPGSYTIKARALLGAASLESRPIKIIVLS